MPNNPQERINRAFELAVAPLKHVKTGHDPASILLLFVAMSAVAVLSILVCCFVSIYACLVLPILQLHRWLISPEQALTSPPDRSTHAE